MLEAGQYYFSTYGDMPYMIIDDGSYVYCAHSNEALYGPYGEHGAIVFGTNSYDGWYDFVEAGDYVSVTGVSAVWKPDPLTADSYRSLFTTGVAVDRINGSSSSPSEVTVYGDVSGIVKLYDMPDETATVHVFSTCGSSQTLTINRDPNTHAGSAAFCWENVPQVEQPLYGQPRNIEYIVSAKCEGFKTRTYTRVVPDTPRNIYMTLLRKIYVTSNTTSIDACSGSATITATVRDADHELVTDNLTIRFRTNKGSFVSGGTIEHEATRTTSTGTATATLYAVASEHGDVVVEATEDSAPHAGDDPDDDPYKYDWQQVHTQYGVPTTIGMTIAWGSGTLYLTADPASIARCGGDTSEITATLAVCGVPIEGTDVNFTALDTGVFDETGTTTATATTNAQGIATVHLKAVNNTAGVSRVIAVAYPYGVYVQYSAPVSVTIAEHNPKVEGEANPATIYAAGDSAITFIATDPQGDAVSGLPLTIETSAGSFVGKTNPFTQSTGVDGKVTVTLHLDPVASARITATYTDECVGSTTVDTRVTYRQQPWKDYGVGYSSPLVADLIAGDGKEVAVIAANSINRGTGAKTQDGRIRLWRSDGTAVTVSDTVIDTTGDNTLSAADIDNRGGLEISAPAFGGYNNKVYAFGYSSAFKPLAGWPVSTPMYAFYNVAAALGDANLDGTTKVVAGDECCYVFSWSAAGEMLWTQVTGSPDVTIENSSVALGDINHTQDAYNIPDALVGAAAPYIAGMWGFAGDDWGDYAPGYNLTDGWLETNVTNSVHCSPVIGLIDEDGYNDIAVGDDSGNIWMWLSSDPDTWHSYDVGAAAIRSSPAIANLDGDPCVIFGCNDGRVYAIHADGTAATGWSGGILLREGTRQDPEGGLGTTPYSVRASIIVGNVLTDTTDPQVIAGCLDGNVYALWKDGSNHAGGPVAKVWTCVQSDSEAILSTPTLCSLDGTALDMIVGSTDGIYRINFPTITFDPGNTTRWPWTTFHYNVARTGCSTAPSATMVSSSIVGRVKSNATGNWISGASVQVEWYNGSSWTPTTPVYGRPTATRTNPVSTVGTGSNNDEINEGGFVFNQLTPGRQYRLVVSKSGYTTQTVSVNGGAAIAAGATIMSDIAL